MPLLCDITNREIARMHDRMIAGVLAYYTYLHLQMFATSLLKSTSAQPSFLSCYNYSFTDFIWYTRTHPFNNDSRRRDGQLAYTLAAPVVHHQARAALQSGGCCRPQASWSHLCTDQPRQCQLPIQRVAGTLIAWLLSPRVHESTMHHASCRLTHHLLLPCLVLFVRWVAAPGGRPPPVWQLDKCLLLNATTYQEYSLQYHRWLWTSIIIMKSSVNRDNNYCHYVILRNAGFLITLHCEQAIYQPIRPPSTNWLLMAVLC